MNLRFLKLRVLTRTISYNYKTKKVRFTRIGRNSIISIGCNLIINYNDTSIVIVDIKNKIKIRHSILVSRFRKYIFIYTFTSDSK